MAPPVVEDEGTRYTGARFKSLRKLTRTRLGELYLAKDEQLARDLTLKLLRAERNYDAAAKAGLEREGRLLARVDHPNVVTLHDIGQLGAELCLSLGPVGRDDLRSWLETTRRDSEVLAVLVQVARGLAGAHAAGVAHCNLRPACVRIDERQRVRLIDFELARPLEAEPGPWERSEPCFAGDPDYLAPEAAERGRRDARGDQYSFCVLAWEALSGCRPPHDPAAAARGARLRSQPAFRVLARGLARAPEKRWPDMASLVAELERARRGLGPNQRARRAAFVLCSILGSLAAAATLLSI